METTVRRSKFDMTAWSPHALGVLRIVTAFLFMSHGMAKILHVPFQQQYANLQLFSLIGVAGLLELVGGALVLVGLFTRPVAFILSGEMAVPISRRMRRARSCRCSIRAMPRCFTASSSCISFSPAPGRGASTVFAGAGVRIRAVS